jgi:hypothetical protein
MLNQVFFDYLLVLTKIIQYYINSKLAFMKRIIVYLSILSCISLEALSQEINIPVPEYKNSVYQITKDGLVPLEKQRSKIIIKAALLKFKNKIVFVNPKSILRITSHNLKFIYEPTEMVDPETSLDIQVLSSNKKNREGFYSTTDMSFNVTNNNPTLPFKASKYKNRYIIFELNNLPKGEYGVSLGIKDGNSSETLIHLFGID